MEMLFRLEREGGGDKKWPCLALHVIHRFPRILDFFHRPCFPFSSFFSSSDFIVYSNTACCYIIPLGQEVCKNN